MKKYILLFSVLLLIENNLSSQNLDYDQEQGAEAAVQVGQMMGVDSTTVTATFIADVGNRIVAQLENRQFDYNFYLADTDQPNAFALPGGYVYVTRGILVLLNSEDELAGIMGHEVIHAHNRHSYQSMKKSILPTILKIPGNVISLVNKDFGKLINAPIEFGSSLRLAKYSRTHETEADTEGIQLVALAGYEPQSLATALSNLIKDVEYLTGEEEKFNYFQDHPYTPERVENIEIQSKQIVINEQPNITSSPSAFIRKLEGIYFGQNPRNGLVIKNRFLHAGLNLDLTFPEGWELSNNPSYVAAVQPDTKAQMYMLIAGPGSQSPADIGNAFIEKFKEEGGEEKYQTEEFLVNGQPAFRFSLDGFGRNREETVSTIFWIKKGNLIYQIVGAGEKIYEDEFRTSVMSLLPLDDKAKAKIQGTILKVESAKEGETLKEFSERTGNALKVDFLALINDIEVDSQLSEGQLLKIGITKLYTPGN